jgi:twitching motility protein PilT
MLSESLRAVIAQTLLPRSGGGRVAAHEILIVNPSISNLIREGKTFQIESQLQTGKKFGMQTLNTALLELVQAGTVTAQDAWMKAIDRQNLKEMFERNGVDTSSLVG